MTDQETHYDDSVEDPESKLLSSPPRRLRRIRISPDLEHDEATVPILEQFRMMPWERLGILGLVALIIIAATVLATTVLGGRNGATYDVDGVENTSPPYFTGLSVIDLTKLCPEGATSFDPSKLPFNVFQRQGDFAAMLAAEVMDGADLDPYSCSPQNLAVLWLAAHPPQTLLQDTLARRYVLTAFYFSLKGWLWKEDGNWLHEDDECTWNGITCNQNGAVTSISLKHNNLKGSLPEELRHLSLLEAFHVSQNSISGTLPTALSKLPKLGTCTPTTRTGHNLSCLFVGLATYASAFFFIVELEVSLNEFTGTVPIELFKQSHLSKSHSRSPVSSQFR